MSVDGFEMEFSSQHQTQCAESFSPENYLRYLLLKLKVSKFDYMRLLKVTRNSFQHKIGKQLVHMNYISALVSETQHFHESYLVTCHGLSCLNLNSFNQNGGICDKINCNQRKVVHVSASNSAC